MLEYKSGKYDVERVVRIGKGITRFNNFSMIQGCIGEHGRVDIASLDVGASSTEIRKAAPVGDRIIDEVLTSSRTEIEYTMFGFEHCMDLAEKQDTGI